MSLINRAKNILLSPKTEWTAVDAEEATPMGLYTGYAMILAAIPALAGLVLGFLFMGRLFGSTYLLMNAVLTYIVGLAVIYLMAIIANALAPSFDGTKDQTSAFKLLIYAATAYWVAGIFLVIPILGWLVVLAGLIYSGYLLYLGSQTVMKVPQDKAVGYTIVVILIWFVLGIVASMIVSRIVWRFAIGASYYPGVGY